MNNAIASKGYANPNYEYESKFILRSKKALQKLLGENSTEKGIIQRLPNLCPEFLKAAECGYAKKITKDYIYSRPVSWYIDDKNFLLDEQDITLRTRFAKKTSKKIDPSFKQHCIKGNAAKFNGPGGSKRLEDEVLADSMLFSTSYFTNEETKLLINGIKDETLGLHFATDVKRKALCAIVNVDGNDMGFEISFDINTYIAPDIKTMTTLPFYKQIEVEIEYIHPYDSDGNLTPLAKKLGLGPATEEEVEMGTTIITEQVLDIADDVKVIMTPETISKGQRGFIEKKAQNKDHFVLLSNPDAPIIMAR